MGIVRLSDRERLARFFRSRDPYLHLYEVGDLDGRFWPSTLWFAQEEAGEILEVALLYTRPDPPVLIALADGDSSEMRRLLSGIEPELPARCYAHLTPGLESAFCRRRIESHGRFLRMALLEPDRLASAETGCSVRLGPADRSELEAFYAACYPGNWFDPWMLETGFYFGLREGGRIASVAGVHVVSRDFGVAALGNIATDHAFRGRGFARIVTARLCMELLAEVVRIGLNVSASNRSAIACYEALGFRTVHAFEEMTMTEAGELPVSGDPAS